VPDPRVNVVLGAKDEATKVVTGLRGQFEKFRKDAVTGFGLGAGIGVFNLAQQALGSVVNVMGDAVGMALEEEAGISRLDAALKANIDSWDGNRDAIEEVINAREELAFSDGEQRDSLSKLVSVTKDVNEALGLQAVAMDLARLRGMDLASASELIGKVSAGNLGILSRYGIVLEKGATATEALAEIQRRAAGQAEAYAQTTQGKLTTAQIELENAMETVGTALLPIVAGFADLVADVIPALVDGLEMLGRTWNDLFRFMSPHEALWQDTIASLRELATAQGLDADAVVRLVEAERRQTEAAAAAADMARVQSAEIDALIASSREAGMSAEDLTALEASLRGALEQTTTAIVDNADAGVLAQRILDDLTMQSLLFGRALPVVAEGMDEVGTAIGDTAAVERELNAAMQQGAAQAKALNDAMTTVGTEGFREFAKGVDEARKRMSILMHDKGRFQRQLGEINRDILFFERAEERAIENKNAVALAAARTELAKLRDMRAMYRDVRHEMELLAAQASKGAAFVVSTVFESSFGSFQDWQRGQDFQRPHRGGGRNRPHGGGGGRDRQGHSHPIVMDGKKVADAVDARLGSQYAAQGRGSYYRTAE